MNIVQTDIPEVIIIEPKVFTDDRGYFFESWSKHIYSSANINCDFIQDNESKSKYGVLRGLHWQAAPYTQAKLIRVISGKVLDVAVDIRHGSPTYGKHVAVEISDENKWQIFIPQGFAHGFVVLSEEVVVAYKCDNIYHPESERGLAFDDPELNIDWQVPLACLSLSPKDLRQPKLADIEPWVG